MRKVDFDQYVEEYDELLNENVSFFSKDDTYFARYKVDLVKKNTIKKPMSILEYGAGIGRNLPFLSEDFSKSKIWAYDISQKSIQVIKRRYPFVNILEKVEEKKALFDLVFVAGVYHHVKPSERKYVTKTIHDVITDNGEIFIFEHNPYNFLTRRLVDRCEYDTDAILLKPYQLRELLQDSGFKILKTKYYLYFPPFFYLNQLEKFLNWIPLGGQYFIHAEKI